MSNIEKSKQTSLVDLVADIENYELQDQKNYILNQVPPAKWIKTHPIVKSHKYLPIDKIEFLLRAIFKETSIEILDTGTAFNGVWVSVRVHYKDFIDGKMKFHDGIGAAELQTKKGESVANLNAINSGAISMAFPIAKTLAVKDACDHFGRLFGSDLNRKDIAPIKKPESPHNYEEERISKKIDECKTHEDLETIRPYISEKYLPKFKAKIKEINQNKK